LSDEDVACAGEQLREIFGPAMTNLMAKYGVSPENYLRFNAVAERCRDARMERGASIKELAAILRVPQARLLDIEASSCQRVRPEVLRSYVALLGLESWFGRWRRQNATLYASLGGGDA
jgi:hypothetical protein